MGRRKRMRGHTLDELLAVFGKGAFDKNIARVSALTSIYDSLPGAVKRRSSGGGADVLRAGVVLLHASLEDLLRRIAKYRIPNGSEESLKQIPLIGCAPREKFALGELVRLRGKTVDDVLSDSVRHYFDSSVTFNNVADIVAVLERCGIKQGRIKTFYPALAELIARRHHIVHRADVLGAHPRKDNVVRQGSLGVRCTPPKVRVPFSSLDFSWVFRKVWKFTESPGIPQRQ